MVIRWRKHNIKIVTDGDKGSEYIISINDISQSDHGPLSGWLYYVNGEMAMVSMAQNKLKPNDKIEVLYSTDNYCICKTEQTGLRLRLYDEVILKGKNLYDGKVIS